MRALFVFTPSESKRFIGKAVSQMSEVKNAKKNGEIVIGHGSTNVRVAEEKKEALDRAIRLIESIKREPPLRPKKSLCVNCLPIK